MLINEAKTILLNSLKGVKILSITEYKSCFAFTTDISEMDNCISVDKKSGKIKIFNPRDIPLEEFRNGKVLKDPDLQMDAFFEHYGIPRRSGRYPWGSGKNPYQSTGGVAKVSKKKTSLKSIIAKKKASIKKKQRANAAKAKAKKRKEYLESPSKLYKHRKEFTKDEIDAAMKQFKWEKELRDLSKNELDTGARYVDAFVKYASSGINAYNTIARVVNTFGDESSRFSYIEPIDAAKNKKKDK